MSEEKDDLDSMIRNILPLVKEYTTKFGDYDWLEKQGKQINKLIPPGRKLAQFVSQRLNHVKDDALRMESEIRLAEFEAVLVNVQSK